MPDSKLERLPLFPLGTVLFPGMDLPLHIFEDRYKQLIEERRFAEPAFGVVLITGGSEVGDQPATAEVGTAANIVAIHDYDDGRHDLVARGGRRFRVVDRDWSVSYLIGTVEWLDELEDVDAGAATIDAVWQSFVSLANAYLRQTRELGMEPAQLDAPEMPVGLSPSALGYLLASRLPVASAERQSLLGASSSADLLQSLIQIMTRERRLVTRIGATVVMAGRGSSKPSE